MLGSPVGMGRCTFTGNVTGTVRVTGPVLSCLWFLFSPLLPLAINSLVVEEELLEILNRIQKRVK